MILSGCNRQILEYTCRNKLLVFLTNDTHKNTQSDVWCLWLLQFLQSYSPTWAGFNCSYKATKPVSFYPFPLVGFLHTIPACNGDGELIISVSQFLVLFNTRLCSPSDFSHSSDTCALAVSKHVDQHCNSNEVMRDTVCCIALYRSLYLL